MNILRVILCIVFPPLAVLDKGCGSVLLVAILSCLGWIPGVLAALVISSKQQPVVIVSGGAPNPTQASTASKSSGIGMAIVGGIAALILVSPFITGTIPLSPAKKNAQPVPASPATPTYFAPKAHPQTPAVDPLPDLATVPRMEWPKEVRTREVIAFAISAGNLNVPAGATVKLVSISGDTVSLDFQGARATTKANACDVAERIRDTRKAMREAEMARMKAQAEATRLAAERAAKEEEELKALRDANRKKLEAEIGVTPIRGGWKQNEPPGIVRLSMKQVLKDPDSVQYIDAFEPVVATYKGQKCWGLKFRFRAKNSFGGYAVNTAYGYIFNGNLIGLELVDQ